MSCTHSAGSVWQATLSKRDKHVARQYRVFLRLILGPEGAVIEAAFMRYSHIVATIP